MANLYFIAILQGALALNVLVLAQDQSGFISIDCGISEESSYRDEATGIDYVPDTNFIDSGVNKTISPLYRKNNLEKQFWNVRSFPEGTKNCYTLKPRQGKNENYLIRARFMHGNYETKDQLPEFDLYLGVNRWGSVKLEDASSIITMEMILVPSTSHIYVCLVNTGSGTPFISALELRHLNNNTYITQSGSLELYTRVDFGLNESLTVRFPDDVYDRMWLPLNSKLWEVLNTSSKIDDSDRHNDYQPASTVMRTAVTPENDSKALEFYWQADDPNSQFYIYMHFAEIKKLKGNKSREFNIYLNEELWYGPLVPDYLFTTTIYSRGPVKGEKFQVFINKTENSTLPPIINAVELYTVKDLPESETDQRDADAIINIKTMYEVKRNWQGDPCAPKNFSWDGLDCRYDSSDPPRITSLNLSSSGLSGEIATYISNLTMLQYLDLSNNRLNGTLPNFLSQLAFLQLLNLEGNNLSGLIPEELFRKKENGSLLLRSDKNPNLCQSISCKDKNNKKKLLVLIGAPVGGFVFFLLVAGAIFWSFKKRKQGTNTTTTTREVNTESNQKDEESKSTGQFSYSEILRITNNFEKVVGKGGFGTVYHGYLGDTQVAVKMLSQSSVQGYKQFQAEAKLLMRIQHRNLTTLVGYCEEGTNLGLIYEYMEKGNLEKILSERNPNFLSWEERLRIALDAAQGLEYLHNDCRPSIIHRDVKSTNILLNEKFEAKLADFGMSRIFPVEDNTSHVSTVVAGTPGYLDPEYFISNRLNEKSDVFSYGVVLLEIITSRPAIAKNPGRTHVSGWVSFMLAKGEIKNIVDPRLQGDFHMNSLWKVVELAMACVSPASINRPNMTHVVMELNRCLEMEVTRKNETIETESKEVNEMATIDNLNPELSPVER